MISNDRLMEIDVQFYRHKDAFWEVIEAYRSLRDDVTKAIELLDKAGVWTGADDVLHDRVQEMVNELAAYRRLTDALDLDPDKVNVLLRRFIRERNERTEQEKLHHDRQD